eukprot:CAMPEP_0119159678 /NCGR_PEP_ID=MMETSP1310-20130426/53886_1 /TAXON_ID=464262 /ORGANISM="Genus nov. species nov., Strain RCC2339" /LENGTH=72 /DNA_ID=CAMNT_0007152309 /DNA_START=381 /DNA_END=600 /DNA_ORIENTATION=-
MNLASSMGSTEGIVNIYWTTYVLIVSLWAWLWTFSFYVGNWNGEAMVEAIQNASLSKSYSTDYDDEDWIFPV